MVASSDYQLIQTITQSSKPLIDPVTNLLKILAIALMTIDHVGLFLFPQTWELRLIGRLSAPIFIYLIIQGLEHTSNTWRYFRRLVVLAIISQIIFVLSFNFPFFNIIWSFLGLIVLLRGPIWAKILLVPLFGLLEIEYGWLVLAAGTIYQLVKNPKWQLFYLFLINTTFTWLNFWQNGAKNRFYLLQIGAFFGFVIVYFVNKYRQKILPIACLNIRFARYFFYAYYPVHVAVLVFLSKIR